MVDFIAKDKLAFVYVGGHEKESRSFVSTFFFFYVHSCFDLTLKFFFYTAPG